MDKVIVVKANKKTQIQRVLTQSGWGHDEVVARINNQMPINEKIKYADFVLDNSLDKASLRKKVKDLYIKLSFFAAKNDWLKTSSIKLFTLVLKKKKRNYYKFMILFRTKTEKEKNISPRNSYL